MNNIFLSYRRGDSGPTTGRMFDSLAAYFGRDAVFKDVDSIPVGASFPEHLTSVLQQCGVTLVVIGPRWATIADERGNLRLDNPGDFVRIEVETALRSDALVIPVLVDGASMPSVEQLPESLRPLRRLNATSVRPDPDYRSDMARLIKIVERHLLSRAPAPASEELAAKYQPADVYQTAWRWILIGCGVVALIVVACAALVAVSVYLIPH
jgi:hypothetical protein